MKGTHIAPEAQVSPTATLVFAGFRLDCRNRRLQGPDGTELPVSARAFDTLRCLASHPHELLSRQRLMREIWPNSIVEDNNLDQQISVLRKLLGEEPGRRFIVTVTGQGFRFVQDVEPLDSQDAGLPSIAFRLFRPWHAVLIAGVAAASLLAWGWVVTHPADSRALDPDYLAARSLIRKSGSTQVRQAIDLLEKAVQRDPRFAPAWAALAEGYTYAADFPPSSSLQLTPVELQQRVASAALKAFELAPDAPATLRAAGMVSMQNRNWVEAEQRLRRALQLAGPHDYEANLQYAWFLMNVGRASEAMQYEERAMRAEPTLMRPVALRAALYEMRGDLDAAQSLLLNSTNLQEHDALRMRGLMMVRMARQDRCGEPVSAAADGLPCPLIADPRGRLAAIREYFGDATHSGNFGQIFPLSYFAAFLGDRRLAFDMLNRWADGPTQNVHILWRTVMRDVRRMPDFPSLVRKLGLENYWRASGNWGDFCHPVGPESFTCSPPLLSSDLRSPAASRTPRSNR